MKEIEKEIIQTMQFLRYGEPLEMNQDWLLEQIESPELRSIIKKLSILSLNVLYEIGRHEDQNPATIAESLNVTRGGVSRISKRLLNDSLIEVTQKSDNQKEKFYILTSQGQLVFEAYDKLVQRIYQKNLDIIRQFSAEEQQTIFSYIKKVSELSVQSE